MAKKQTVIIDSELLAKIEAFGKELGMLIAAAISASDDAIEQAQDRDMSVMIEENGSLYYLNPDGTKKFIKRLKNSMKRVPNSKFSIE